MLELLTKWGTPHGGFIGTDYGESEDDHRAIGVDEAHARYLYEAFVKLGRYPIRGAIHAPTTT